MAVDDKNVELTNAVGAVMDGLPIKMTVSQLNEALGKLSDMTKFFNDIIQEVLRETGLTLSENHDAVIERASQLAEQRLMQRENDGPEIG